MTTWPQPGDAAVILQPYAAGAASRLVAKPVTVDRLTKRDVVTDDGERFRRDGLRRQDGGAYGTTTYLVKPDDPRVAETRTLIQRRNLTRRAETAAARYGRKDGPTAREVAAAWTALAEFEETHP